MLSELRARIKHEQGQSLVEFSLGAVLLLILLAGVVDATRALFTYMALRDAAQEGASYGAMNADISKAAVRYQIVSRICKGSNMFQNVSCNDITIDSSAAITVELVAIGPACSGNSLTVRLRYARFPLTMPFLGTILGSQTVPISTSITDTILQPIECP